MSTARTLSKIGQTAGAGDAWVRTAGNLYLSTSGLVFTNWDTQDSAWNSTVNSMVPTIATDLGYYAMARGILQMIEAIGYAAGEEKKYVVGLVQFITAATSTAIGYYNSFVGTCIVPLELALCGCALVEMAKTLINYLSKHYFPKNYFPTMSTKENRAGPFTNLLEAASFLFLANDKYWACSQALFTSSIFSPFIVYGRTDRLLHPKPEKIHAPKPSPKP